jgi:hypothetical protein
MRLGSVRPSRTRIALRRSGISIAFCDLREIALLRTETETLMGKEETKK